MTAPPWSALCSADDRLRALDDLVADLIVDDLVDGDTAVALLALNRRYSTSPHGWDHARTALRCFGAEATPADFLVLAMYETFSPAQLESLPVALQAGALPDELVALRVCGLNAQGEDLAVIEAGELQRRAETALRLEQDGQPSRWLDGYAKLLAAEGRRRGGFR